MFAVYAHSTVHVSAKERNTDEMKELTDARMYAHTFENSSLSTRVRCAAITRVEKLIRIS